MSTLLVMKSCSSWILRCTFIYLLQTSLVWAVLLKNSSYDDAPRPSLIPDEVLVLDQEKWDFAVGESLPTEFIHKINFGFAPESELSGVDYESLRPNGSKDFVWYKKTLKIPGDWKGALLTLEGVDYESELYINNKFVTSHRGAYAPIEVNITPYLTQGTDTTILLRATDDRLARDRAVGKQERRLHEGVIFYGNSSGAWKGAHLRKIDPALYISNFIHRANSQGVFSYQVEVAGTQPGPFETEIKLIERASKKVAATNNIKFRNAFTQPSEIKIENPKLWTPENPSLYDVEVKLYSQGKLIERMRSYTGFSDFKQTEGYFYLNNRPFYLRGVLNQMVYPRGLYTPDMKESNAHDILMMKKHGFNFQRVHQTTPRWRDIYEMEKLGIGWSLEMPSARDLREPAALKQFVKEWKEIIRAYGHGHPGLFYFVPGNEDWGLLEDPDHWSGATDSEREAFQLTLLKATLEVAPPGAIVSPGDGWRQITGIKNGSKLNGINPEQIILSAHDYRGSGSELIQAYGSISLNAGPGTTFPRNGKELILNGFDFPGKYVAPMLGEFGGKSYAPPGIGNVFGYGHVYRDLTQWSVDSLMQLKSLGQLKIMRGGYVYTQLRDAGFKPHVPLPPDRPAGELNGFLSADGIPKSDPNEWRKLNVQNQSLFEQNYLIYRSLEGLKASGTH
jgi:hypothetical protein